MSGPQVKWELIGDVTKSSAAVDKAIAKTDTITGKLRTVGTGMVLGVGIGAFNLLSNAVGGAVGFLGDAKAAFEEDQRSAALLTVALRNNIPAWDGVTSGVEAYATAQGKLGFADDEVRESIGQLVGVTHDLSKAQEDNTLAQDLARAKKLSLAQATDIVTKAELGNGKALKGLGIDIGKAKTGAEMLDAVQKNVKGSAEEWAKTSEGKLAVSQVRAGEAMEKFGKTVSRLAEQAVPVLTGALELLADSFDKLMSPVKEDQKLVTDLYITVDNGPFKNQVVNINAFNRSLYENTTAYKVATSAAADNARETRSLEAAETRARQATLNLGAASLTVAGELKSPKGILSALDTVIDDLKGIVLWGPRAIAKLGELYSTFLHLFGPTAPKPSSHGENAPGSGSGGHAAGGWVGLGGPERVLVGEMGPEYVIPNKALLRGSGGGGGSGVTVNINGPIYGGPAGLDELANAIVARVRYVTGV